MLIAQVMCFRARGSWLKVTICKYEFKIQIAGCLSHDIVPLGLNIFNYSPKDICL